MSDMLVEFYPVVWEQLLFAGALSVSLCGLTAAFFFVGVPFMGVVFAFLTALTLSEFLRLYYVGLHP